VSRRALLAALLAFAACGRGEVQSLGIGTRVTLDRSQARVGDPIGVTVEIETPPGYSVQAPPAPGGDSFASDSVELVEPIPVPGGLRHHLLWTLRAREVGEQALPWIDIPLVRPDGNVQPLRVGGTPLPVLSVKADLPERAAVFDIRGAPPQRPTPIWVWALAALGGALSVLVFRALRRRALAAGERAGRVITAGRGALALLDGVEAESDARRFATRVRAALLGFVEGCWNVNTASVTPGELPAEVDGDIVRILGTLEAARFAPHPGRAAIAGLAENARERVRHVANLRA
jgi:hypothetical protein